jgi:hypothetical protein
MVFQEDNDMPAPDKKFLYTTEGREMRRFDIARCSHTPAKALSFSVDETNGQALPEGLSIDNRGQLSGRLSPGASRHSPYQLLININGDDEQVAIELHVGPQMLPEDISHAQAEIWKALESGAAIPEDIRKIVERPITKLDIYHLLERYAAFTIWNADDMQLADEGKKIKVSGLSDKFEAYDFGVCLVTTPKDLYSHTRTKGDMRQTARALAKEAHHRHWHVEFGGFDQMASTAWKEIQTLNKTSSHKMEVRNYTPPGVTPAQAPEEQAEPE